MLEGVPVIVHIIVIVVGIGEKVVFPAKHIRRADIGSGKKGIFRIFNLKHFSFLIIKRFP
jgi:hypothetical protein